MQKRCCAVLLNETLELDDSSACAQQYCCTLRCSMGSVCRRACACTFRALMSCCAPSQVRGHRRCSGQDCRVRRPLPAGAAAESECYAADSSATVLPQLADGRCAARTTEWCGHRGTPHQRQHQWAGLPCLASGMPTVTPNGALWAEPFTAVCRSKVARLARATVSWRNSALHCAARCAGTSQRTSETQSRRVRQSSVLQSTCTTRRRYGCGYAVRCDSATSAATDRPSLRSRRDK